MAKLKKILVRCKTKEDLEKLSERLFKDNPDGLSFGEDAIKSITLSKDHSPQVQLKKKGGPRILDIPDWKKQWTDMNEYKQENVKYYSNIDFFLEEGFSISKFSELVEQSLTPQTKSLYYPRVEPGANSSKRYTSKRGNPDYPIYIISKGRANTCITAEHLIKMEVPFKIVIEQQEFEDYAKNFDEDVLLVLDMSFKKDYDPYINDFDEEKSKGSGPARNFVWWHSKEIAKAKWHWIMDDNIFGFYLLNNNMRIKATDGGLLAATEDFVNRYDNIGISGLNYFMFTTPGGKSAAYVSNTKIYSCLLIRNDLPLRWAGRYNEDVDICIRTMKEGYSTIQFNAFLADKLTTQAMGGGNTTELYGDGTLAKSKMLASNHPDITTVVWRFSRWHHHTDYGQFQKNKDRSMNEIILSLKETPVLKPNCEETKNTIKLLEVADYTQDLDWDNLTQYITDLNRKDKFIAKVKYNKYLRDANKIIAKCTADAVLDVSVDSDTIEELYLLEESHNLSEEINWDEHLIDLEEDRKALVIKEIERNRHIKKSDYKTYDYDFNVVRLTQEEHLQHKDSKHYVDTHYNNIDRGEEVLTLGDKIARGLIQKPEKVKFVHQLTKGYDKVEKADESYSLIVTGSIEFNDKDLLIENLDPIIEVIKAKHNNTEIVNGTQKGTDILAADYSLSNGIKCKDIRPDFVSNSDFAIKVNNEKMAKYADEAIVFLRRGDEDYTQMVEVMEALEKPVTVVYYEDSEDVFGDF